MCLLAEHIGKLYFCPLLSRGVRNKPAVFQAITDAGVVCTSEQQAECGNSGNSSSKVLSASYLNSPSGRTGAVAFRDGVLGIPRVTKHSKR